jgi:hypothetical protein
LTKPALVEVGRGSGRGAEEGGAVGKEGWHECAHFRFPLPEGVSASSLSSSNPNRERLFAGPPVKVKIGIYSRGNMIMGDSLIGFAEADLQKIGEGGGGEEWLPLMKDGGSGWFVRARVSVHFELMRLQEQNRTGGGVN